MKACLFIGLMLFGMVATESAVVSEYESGGVDPFESTAVEEEVQSRVETAEDEVLVCLEDEEPVKG